jgi:hypothetical protein
MDFPRGTRKYVRVPVSARDDQGAPIELAAVDVALLPPRDDPEPGTVWLSVPVTGGAARILVAEPDAAGEGALVIPHGGARLWVRVVDAPEVDVIASELFTLG